MQKDADGDKQLRTGNNIERKGMKRMDFTEELGRYLVRRRSGYGEPSCPPNLSNNNKKVVVMVIN